MLDISEFLCNYIQQKETSMPVLSSSQQSVSFSQHITHRSLPQPFNKYVGYIARVLTELHRFPWIQEFQCSDTFTITFLVTKSPVNTFAVRFCAEIQRFIESQVSIAFSQMHCITSPLGKVPEIIYICGLFLSDVLLFIRLIKDNKGLTTLSVSLLSGIYTM